MVSKISDYFMEILLIQFAASCLKRLNGLFLTYTVNFFTLEVLLVSF